MRVKEITDLIESFAPLAWQEHYDNAGLIVGRYDDEVNRILLAVDVTEEVLDEAEREGCDMIISHHPIIFHPLKRLNSATYVERCVERAIRRGIALYACHTNLDSAPDGMSWRLAQILGLERCELLENSVKGEGVGFGVVGELPEGVEPIAWLRQVKERLSLGVIRHSEPVTNVVRRVALCTGAGASLIGEARRAGADLYLTADLKYNDFMTPDKALMVADIGHFESEYCAIDILFDILSKKISTFALLKSAVTRTPIRYLC